LLAGKYLPTARRIVIPFSGSSSPRNVFNYPRVLYRSYEWVD